MYNDRVALGLDTPPRGSDHVDSPVVVTPTQYGRLCSVLHFSIHSSRVSGSGLACISGWRHTNSPVTACCQYLRPCSSLQCSTHSCSEASSIDAAAPLAPCPSATATMGL